MTSKGGAPAAPCYYPDKAQNYTLYCLTRQGGENKRGEALFQTIDDQYPGLLFKTKKRGPAAPWYCHDEPQNYTLHRMTGLGGKKRGGGKNDNQYTGLLLKKEGGTSCTVVLSR